MQRLSPLRSALYVPGTMPERFADAVASAADSVILDLEDSVPPSRKEDARAAVAAFVREPHAKPVFVRVNGLASGLAEADVAAVAGPFLAGVRLPKTESAADVLCVAAWLDAADCRATLWCLLESALGVERAFEIASAHPRVESISLGEADLRQSLGVRSERALEYARSRCITAARAAGLAAPMLAAYLELHNHEGLRASCEDGLDLGFFGRTAASAEQAAVINSVFTPSPGDVAEAQMLVEAFEAALIDGSGAAVLPDGRLVDLPVVAVARETLALAAACRLPAGSQGGSARA